MSPHEVRKLVRELQTHQVERERQNEELRRAKEAVRKSEEKYRILGDNQTDMIVKSDRKGRLRFVSPSCCRTFGKTEAELLGQRLMPMIHEDDREQVARAFEDAGRPPYTGYVEERSLTENGWRWHAWMNTGIVGENGDVVEIVGVGRDITDLKHAEVALHESENRLFHVARLGELGEMVAEMAHEINQPLYAITNYANTIPRLTSSRAADRDTTISLCAEKLAQQAARAGDLVRRLRRFVEPRAHSPVPMDLDDVIKESLSLLAWLLRSRGVTVSWSPGPPLPKVTGDDVQVQQVLVNLLTNACHALSEIDDRERVIKIGIEVRGEFLETAIEDNGPGLSLEEVETCFDAFHTTKPEGMGIGLPICRTIIHRHGGQIWACSVPQQGATFFFTLPVAITRGVESRA